MNMNIKKRIGKMSFGILLLVVVAMILMAQTSAHPEYFSALQNVYGGGSCATCHIDPNGGSGLTGYGSKFASQSNHAGDPATALKAIGEPHVEAPRNMSTFVLALQGVYGNGSCATCHINPNGGKDLTIYGKKFSAQSGHDSDPIVAIRVIGSPEENAATMATTVETTEKKSPGFEIVVTIGMISAIYIFRKNKIK